ncbi:nucleophile aminohydrolase, partial [Jimgerdemannia flammicorona]
MFCNQYDNDISTWSPQRRIHQIEYALEVVKQGSMAVSLRSNEYAVLLALKHLSGKLASYQKKLIHIDNHMGIAIARLTSNARVLSNFIIMADGRMVLACLLWAMMRPALIYTSAHLQSAKTYLERYHEEFPEASLNQLVKHGLYALHDTLQQDKELNIHNTLINIVDKDQQFTIIEGKELQQYLGLLSNETGRLSRAVVTVTE